MRLRSLNHWLALPLLGLGLTLPLACSDKDGGEDDEASDAGSDGGSDAGSSDAGSSDGGSGDGGSGDGGSDPNADNDNDGYVAADDCNDNDPDVHPGADERCDGIDNDCNGEIDGEDAIDATTWYFDGDGDGYGADRPTRLECDAPAEHVDVGGDCDDDDNLVSPGTQEFCDGKDNDCNDLVDDEPTDGDWYAVDLDGDGLGQAGTLEFGCEGVTNELDCDDSDPLEPQVVDIGAGTLSPSGTFDDPWYSIQDGIDNAASCVIVYPGTYREALDLGDADIVLLGVEGSDATVVDADGQNAPALTIAGGQTSDTVVEGFTFAGGAGASEETSEATDCGSGVICTDYYTTYCGGGIYVSGSDPTLAELTIVENSLTEASSTSSGNDDYFVYSYGGGACFVDSAATLTSVIVEDNFADQGGALYVDETSVLELSQSRLSANTSTNGGAIMVDGGSMTLSNVLTTWNSATTEGGGLYVVDGAVAALNVTIGGDDAPSGGSVALSGTSTVLIRNSIMYGSATGDGVAVGSSAVYSGTYNNVYGHASDLYTGIDDPTGTNGNLSEDPTFTAVSDDGDLTNDDWTLRPGSPSIDAGDPSKSLLDADGSRADQGAYGGPGGEW